MQIGDASADTLAKLTAQIVAAYAGNNTLERAQLPDLIASVMNGLAQASAPQPAPAAEAPLVPAVSVRKSVTDDYIVCLEDGKKFKSLKRHLATHYDLTPEAYRAKWSLPHDYPMVAPSYAAARSALALAAGLGRKRTTVAEAAPEPESEKPAPKRRASAKAAAAAEASEDAPKSTSKRRAQRKAEEAA